jgi:surface antigen
VATRLLAFAVLLSLAACGGPRISPVTNYGEPTNLTCVPYARKVSGIQLTGDAYQWWDEAAGSYPRSHIPAIGAVLVFAPHGSMTVGHLAVVTALRDRRTIEVTQSNWLPYRIEHHQPVIDVSAGNDWSEVRVWYEPVHAMGTTIYPAYGFILPR